MCLFYKAPLGRMLVFGFCYTKEDSRKQSITYCSLKRPKWDILPLAMKEKIWSRMWINFYGDSSFTDFSASMVFLKKGNNNNNRLRSCFLINSVATTYVIVNSYMYNCYICGWLLYPITNCCLQYYFIFIFWCSNYVVSRPGQVIVGTFRPELIVSFPTLSC